MLEALSLVINIVLACINIVVIIRQRAVLSNLSAMSLAQERILNKVMHIDESIKYNIANDMKDVAFGAHQGVDPEESEFPDMKIVGSVSEIEEPVSGAFQVITQEEIEHAKQSSKSKPTQATSDSDFDD